MAELLSNKFQQVFTKESKFKNPKENKTNTKMEEVIVNKDEIHKIMEELEERKEIGPDEVSGFILKE